MAGARFRLCGAISPVGWWRSSFPNVTMHILGATLERCGDGQYGGPETIGTGVMARMGGSLR